MMNQLKKLMQFILLTHNIVYKYITKKFNSLPADNFPARLRQANLATKADIDDFV